MDYPPDYGLLIFRSNRVEPNATFDFYSFRLDHVSATAPKEFTTMVEIPVEGVRHAASFDFGIQIMAEIIDVCLDVETLDAISDWYDDLTVPSTLELPKPIEFGLTAKLGELQINGKEQYVPLLIQKVFKIGD